MWGNRDWILKREKGLKVGWLESLHDGQDCQDVKIDLKEAIIEEIIMENFPESIKDVSLRFSHWDRPRHNRNKCSPCCIWQRQKKPEVAWGGFKRAPVRPTTPTPKGGGRQRTGEEFRRAFQQQSIGSIGLWESPAGGASKPPGPWNGASAAEFSILVHFNHWSLISFNLNSSIIPKVQFRKKIEHRRNEKNLNNGEEKERMTKWREREWKVAQRGRELAVL